MGGSLGVIRNGAIVAGQIPAMRGMGTGDGLMNVKRNALLFIKVLAVQRLKLSTNAVAIDSYTTRLCGPRDAGDLPGFVGGAGIDSMSPTSASFTMGTHIGNATLNGRGPAGAGSPGSASPPGGIGMLRFPMKRGAPVIFIDNSN